MNVRAQMEKHRKKLFMGALIISTAVILGLFWGNLVAWFVGAPMGDPSSEAEVTQAGPYELSLAFAPDPPREKDNSLAVTIRENGVAVENARLKISYHMPAMGSMAEMRGEADVQEKGDGRYLGRFDLPMAGSWSLTVAAHKDDNSGEATFNMTVGMAGLTVTHANGGTKQITKPPPKIPQHRFDNATLEHLKAVLSAYDQARGLLANDTLDGLPAHTQSMKAILTAAARGLKAAPTEVSQGISNAATAAENLGKAREIETARNLFGEVSKYLVALASADPRLGEGLNIFKCPMARGFQKWFQPSNHLENPYMGQRMLECGVRSDWTLPNGEPPSHSHAGDDEISHYTCSMHPSVKQSEPETCPICAMDLTPVTKEEVETGTIFIDEIRRQRIGVRIAPAERRQMSLQIRAVGEVKYDETRLSDVNLRMGGWVQSLHVDETGQRVRRGQTLLTLYSPELYAAQIEHLTAFRRGGQETSAAFASLTRASRARLRLLGMGDAQVKELEQRNEAWENMPILAPSSGHVIEKNVVKGARLNAGALAYRIADLSRVWVDAEVYESDLPHIKIGQKVQISLPYVPERKFLGKVDYIYPTLQGSTRTARVRIVLENPSLELKPQMYADVELEVDLGERLAIPDSAVIYTGPRRLVFVDLGEGRLQPKLVKLGVHTRGYYEITEGIEPGDVVVTSGNFLVAAESRIRSAAGYWGGSDDTQ